MKHFFILVSLLISSLVQAQDFTSEQGVTRFDTLTSWYQQGTSLSFAQFKGFYSGRCYRANAKNEAMAAIVGYGTKDNTDGPGFPSGYKTSTMVWVGKEAGYFDDESKFAENRKLYQEVMIREWGFISNYFESPTLGSTYDWEPNGNPDGKSELVLFKNYILVKETALIRQKYKDFGLKNPGDILSMCYFFKKLGE